MGADNLAGFHRWDRWRTHPRDGAGRRAGAAGRAAPGRAVAGGAGLRALAGAAAVGRGARRHARRRPGCCCRGRCSTSPRPSSGRAGAGSAERGPAVSRIDRRALLLGAAAALAAPALPRPAWAAALGGVARGDPRRLGARRGQRLRGRRPRRRGDAHRGARRGRRPAAGLGRQDRHHALRARRARPRLPLPHPGAGGGAGRGRAAARRPGARGRRRPGARHRPARRGWWRRCRRAGIDRVEGRFLVADGALPFARRRGARPAGGRRLQPDALGDEPQLQPRAAELGAGAGAGRSARPGAKLVVPVAGIGGAVGDGPIRHRFEDGREVWSLPAAPGERARQRLAAGAGAGRLRRRGLRRAGGAGRADAAGGRGGGARRRAPRWRCSDSPALEPAAARHAALLDQPDRRGGRAPRQPGARRGARRRSPPRRRRWAAGRGQRFGLPAAAFVDHSGPRRRLAGGAGGDGGGAAPGRWRSPRCCRPRPVLGRGRQAGGPRGRGGGEDRHAVLRLRRSPAT